VQVWGEDQEPFTRLPDNVVALTGCSLVIALWLGHESIATTNVCVHANLALKEKALAKVAPISRRFRRLRANDHLLAFLESL
jgi:hypothetical protein